MSLRDTIAKAAKTAFNAIGDIKETATYRRTVSVYNPSTGTNTLTNTDYPLSVVFTRFENLEIDKNVVQVFDVKMLVLVDSMSVVPNTATDKVIRGGKTYNVLKWNTDPANAVYTVQLRAP